MQKIKVSMQDIVQLISRIETHHPKLYGYLKETPLIIGSASGSITTDDLEVYLAMLNRLLQEHIKLDREINSSQ